MSRIGSLCTGLVSAITLVGCGLAPVQKGQTVTLGPNEGIAAVVTDALNVLGQVEIDGTDPKGATMKIPTAPVGVNMYLFVVPAGHYCLASYSVGMSEIAMDDTLHGDCFDVIAGKIAYSGNLAPRAFSESGTWGRGTLEGYTVKTLQNFEWDSFQKNLKAEYPAIAAKYPVVTP